MSSLIDNMKVWGYLFIVFSLFVNCKPEDKTEKLVCEMTPQELKPILKDILIYEAVINTKSLDSLTGTYSKEAVYRSIYKKHNTSRGQIQESMECLTKKQQIIPILQELELSFKNWKENPEFTIDESQDTIQ